jgi:PAS domain S-box-containing protein
MENEETRAPWGSSGKSSWRVPGPLSAQDGQGLAVPAAVLVDSEGVVAGWTAAAQRLLGYTADEAIGRSAAILIAEADADEVVARWTQVPRRHWSGSATLRAKNGTTRKVLLDAAPMSGERGTDWFMTALDPSGAASWPPTDASVAAALLARAPIGLSVWDTDLRCIWLNGAAATQDDVLGRSRLGRLMTEVQPGVVGQGIVEAMRGVLETGEPVIEREYTWHVPGEEGERVLSASYFRLDGPDGRPIGVCNMATDIEKSRARQHLLALGRMTGRIGTTLDVQRTSQELADAAVPLLADYVTVDLNENVPLGEDPSLNRLPIGPVDAPVFRRAGVASVRPDTPESICGIGEPVFVPSLSPFTRALFSGQTHFEPYLDTSPGTWLDKDPQRAERIARLHMHSLIIVPLRARGTILGEAVFVRHDNPAPFSRDDLLLIEEIVGRAALSLDNARRYGRERTAALALQRDLLPRNLVGGPGVELASRYLPSDRHEGVGGDWYDVVPLPDSRVGLIIGDVVGHGIGAAALMGRLRTVTSILADLDLPPEELLARVDRRVALMTDRDCGEDTMTRAMVCTVSYAVYDPVTRECEIASAGHPAPALVLPDGEAFVPDVPTGPPIGLGTQAYKPVTVSLPPGSVIALYTDGLIETREADLDVGLERLKSALSWVGGTSLDEFATHVVSTMTPQAWRHSAPFAVHGPDLSPGTPSVEDDIALLLARTRALTPVEAAEQSRR